MPAQYRVFRVRPTDGLPFPVLIAEILYWTKEEAGAAVAVGRTDFPADRWFAVGPDARELKVTL